MSERSLFQRFVDGIFQQIEFEEEHKDKTNYEFADWLIENVWADLETDDPLSAVIDECVVRLKNDPRN